MEQFANNAQTTLSAAITDWTSTSITVTSATGFPSSGTFRIIIDSELLAVTAVSGTTWTVIRGDGGSAAANHISGVNVTQILTKEAFNALVTVKSDGTEISDRRVLNFVSGAIVADDPADGQCNITISGGVTYGTAASRPAAGQSGRLYVPSDPGVIVSLDTGSTWVGFNPRGAPFTIPPLVSTWTAIESGANTPTDIPGGGIDVSFNFNGFTTEVTSGLVRNLANGSSYMVILAMDLLAIAYGTEDYGILLTDGTKSIVFGWEISGSEIQIKSNTAYNTGTVATVSGSRAFAYAGNGIWLKIVNDGTHRTYSTSANGVVWHQFYQENSGTFLTETAAGFGLMSNGNTMTVQPGFTVYSWSGA